jgi:hypothetical protein
MLLSTRLFEIEARRWLLFVRVRRRCVCVRKDRFGWMID